MRDLVFLREKLPASPVGLDDADPRLAALRALVDKQDGEALLSAVEAVFDEGVHDVRVAVLYLWGVFHVEGLPLLSGILETVHAMTASHLAGFGPGAKREAHAARRFAWLFKTIADALEYHEVRDTPAWRAWLAAGLEVPLPLLNDIDASLGEALAAARQPFVDLVVRLRRVESLLARTRTAAAADGDEDRTEDGEEREDDDEPASRDEDEAETGGRAFTVEGGAPVGGGLRRVQVGATPRFFELMEKIAGFNALLARGDVGRAAIVAEDVTRLLDNFDPRAYFPALFSAFSQGLSEHIAPIAEHWEERESIAWKAHAQFYQVDLPAFLAGGT